MTLFRTILFLNIYLTTNSILCTKVKLYAYTQFEKFLGERSIISCTDSKGNFCALSYYLITDGYNNFLLLMQTVI